MEPTNSTDRMRTNFAVAAALVLAGHVKHSDAYDVSVTPYEVTLQGRDSDAMRFVARELRLVTYRKAAKPGDFHRWTGKWSGATVTLVADGPLSDHAPDMDPSDAVATLATEAAASQRVDPPECGCTDCITGESRPAATFEEYQAGVAS